MADEFIPTLTHATERDIDLLLVEEIYSSPTFVAWVCGKAGLTGHVASSTVLHSKRRTRSRREIDIFVDVGMTSGAKAALLIENKLDASEQPDQAESYREEIAALSDRFAQRAILLVCPVSYSDGHRQFAGKFDAVVSYEELASYFRSRSLRVGEDSARMRFRAELLDQAVLKSRRGYTPVPNEVIGGFNAQYVTLLRKIAPDIHPGPTMLKEANPDESVSMIFDHNKSFAALPPEIRPRRFSHELGRGQLHRANYVSVVFGGWGGALKQVREALEKDAKPLGATFSAAPATKVRPNPGLVMSCPTEPIDNRGDFATQEPAIIAGIRQATSLRRWLIDNQRLLFDWKQRAEKAISEL